jgi:hypothetical protein
MVSRRFGGQVHSRGAGESYLRESTVVPEVTLVGEAVAHEAQLALLGILLDGVQKLILGDL